MSTRSSSPGSARRVAISQSNYIPWRGYFDLIASVDEFIFYDDVQYTTRDWRNRNRIKTPRGVQWLTVPVGGSRTQRICEVAIPDPDCGGKHWTVLRANYARAPFFPQIASWLEPLFREPWTSLSTLNQRLIGEVCAFLGIRTRFSRSWDYQAEGDRNGRLLALCRQAGAGTYVSGPAAAGYLDSEAFAAAGIEVVWMDYAGYAPYPQLWGPFEPQVTVLDLLFNCGPAAPRHMKFAGA